MSQQQTQTCEFRIHTLFMADDLGDLHVFFNIPLAKKTYWVNTKCHFVRPIFLDYKTYVCLAVKSLVIHTYKINAWRKLKENLTIKGT